MKLRQTVIEGIQKEISFMEQRKTELLERVERIECRIKECKGMVENIKTIIGEEGRVE